MTAPFLPPGAFVDPSHVVAIWVEPETLARIGIGALPLDVFETLRERPPPDGLFDVGPVAPVEPPATITGCRVIDGFPSGGADVCADYLFRVVAFMRSTCTVVRVEAKGSGTDAPLRLTGYRDAPAANGDGVTFDDARPIVVAAIAPRGKVPVEESAPVDDTFDAGDEDVGWTRPEDA